MISRGKTTLSLLWKIEKRTIKNSWKQFLAVITIGAIAVTLLVGLFANAATLERQVNQVYKEGNLADIWVTCNLPTASSNNLNKIKEEIGEFNDVEERLYLPGRIDSHPVDAVIQDKLGDINKPYGEGVYSKDNTEEYYCLIDKAMMKKDGDKTVSTYSLDQDISISFNLKDYHLLTLIPELSSLNDSKYLKEGKNNIFSNDEIGIPVKITGFIQYPENITIASYYTSCSLISNKMFIEGFKKVINETYNDEGKTALKDIINTYLTFATTALEVDSVTVDNILKREVVLKNQYIVKINDGQDVNVIKDKIDNSFRESFLNPVKMITLRSDMPFYMTIDADLTQAKQFTLVFPLVFFLVAFLVILTTLTQMVLKERGQIGTMKALGLTKNQIYNHYIRITWMLVGIGSIIGIILGPLIIPGILGEKYQILYALPQRQYFFPFISASVTFILFMGTAALVTYLVCRSEVRLNPSESMRGEVPTKSLRKSASNYKKTNVAGLSRRMAFRNIRLDKVKSLMVIIGVMGCTALLTCGFGIEDTINYGISNDMKAYNNGDITVNLNVSTDSSTYQNDILNNIEGIVSVEGYFTGISSVTIPSTNKRYNKPLYVIEKEIKDSHLDLDFANNEIGIPIKYAREMGLKEGDEVTISYNGLTSLTKIGQVYESFVYNYVMIDSSHPLFEGQDLDYQNIFVNVDENVISVEDACKEIQKLDYVSKTQTQNDWRENINSVMSGILVMTNAVKIFAILLALVVLYNLALMNYKQRTRDIATLKVLGFYKKEIALSLLIESLTLTFIGSLIGLALGYPFMLAVMETNRVTLVEYLYNINLLTYAISFILTFIVSVVINSYFSFMTRRIQMVESLKSVE